MHSSDRDPDALGDDGAHAVRDRVEAPLRREQPGQLGDEERVAFRALLDRGDERIRGVRRAHGADELPDLVEPEPAQGHVAIPLRAGELGDAGRQFLTGGRIALTARRDHEHGRVGECVREVPQQEQRRRVRGVEVLEHDRDRSHAGDARGAG